MEPTTKACPLATGVKKQGKLAEFIINTLEKNAEWIQIEVGKFRLTEWRNIALQWFRMKKRRSDEVNAPSLLHQALYRHAFPGLSEVNSMSVKRGQQFLSRTFIVSSAVMQDVKVYLQNGEVRNDFPPPSSRTPHPVSMAQKQEEEGEEEKEEEGEEEEEEGQEEEGEEAEEEEEEKEEREEECNPSPSPSSNLSFQLESAKVGQHTPIPLTGNDLKGRQIMSLLRTSARDMLASLSATEGGSAGNSSEYLFSPELMRKEPSSLCNMPLVSSPIVQLENEQMVQPASIPNLRFEEPRPPTFNFEFCESETVDYSKWNEMSSISLGSSPSVTDAAIRKVGPEMTSDSLKIVYPNLLDIGCYSHTIDHVGEQFVTPVLEEFAKAWVGLFAHSPKA